MAWTFTTPELAAMRAAHTAHYNDACKIGTYTDAGADAYNNPSPTWPLGDEMPCGFMVSKVGEELDEAYVPVADGKIRLPIGTVITSKDRIQLTKRHGTAITPILYNVVGDVRRGPSGLVVDVQMVTNAG